MRSRASESVRVGTLWNSPNLSSMPASSSPVGFSRWRDVDDRAAMFGCKIDRRCRRCLTGPDKIRSYGASERLIEARRIILSVLRIRSAYRYGLTTELHQIHKNTPESMYGYEESRSRVMTLI